MMKIVVHFEDREPELCGTYVDTDPETGAITYADTDGRWSTVPGDVGAIVDVPLADPTPFKPSPAIRIGCAFPAALVVGDELQRLHDRTSPLPGRPGWRGDVHGREWFSAAWLNEVPA